MMLFPWKLIAYHSFIPYPIEVHHKKKKKIPLGLQTACWSHHWKAVHHSRCCLYTPPYPTSSQISSTQRTWWLLEKNLAASSCLPSSPLLHHCIWQQRLKSKERRQRENVGCTTWGEVSSDYTNLTHNLVLLVGISSAYLGGKLCAVTLCIHVLSVYAQQLCKYLQFI